MLIVIDFNYCTNNFILMHPFVFSSIMDRQKYPDQYNTLMSSLSATCFSLHELSAGTFFYNNLEMYVHMSMQLQSWRKKE
jgi:hypothetical protein